MSWGCVMFAAIFGGFCFYAGGHPDQVASRASLLAAWIKAKFNRGAKQ